MRLQKWWKYSSYNMLIILKNSYHKKLLRVPKLLWFISFSPDNKKHTEKFHLWLNLAVMWHHKGCQSAKYHYYVQGPRECVVWLAAHHQDRRALEFMSREIAPAGTGMGKHNLIIMTWNVLMKWYLKYLLYEQHTDQCEWITTNKSLVFKFLYLRY